MPPPPLSEHGRVPVAGEESAHSPSPVLSIVEFTPRIPGAVVLTTVTGSPTPYAAEVELALRLSPSVAVTTTLTGLPTRLAGIWSRAVVAPARSAHVVPAELHVRHW